jgi:hypothetical protein
MVEELNENWHAPRQEKQQNYYDNKQYFETDIYISIQ